MTDLQWYTNESVDEAIAEAKRTGRRLLIDLWHPTCLGCAKLFATTYAREEVRSYLAGAVVPVKYNTTKPNPWFKRINPQIAHFWHPHLLIADDRLTEGRRFIGYVGAETFVANVMLGVGLLNMYCRRFLDARRDFERAATRATARNVVAEALYWQGIAAYRLEGRDGLAGIWERLMAEYPETDWAEKADCLDVQIPEEGFDPTDASSVLVLPAVPRT